MHKPHKNLSLIVLKTSSSSSHLSLDPSPTVLNPQVQSYALIEDIQCSSRIISLKTPEASKIFYYLESPLEHCPHLPSCSSDQAGPPNPQAITS